MELKIEAMTIPSAPSFNYEELRGEIIATAERYKSLVYTDDTIKDAKKDRANLNSFKKALNDARIRMEKEYLAPFTAFKNQVAELIGIIDQPCQLIDQQIKEYENNQKIAKLNEIRSFAAEISFPVELDAVIDAKWLNASVSMKSIKDELLNMAKKIQEDLQIIDQLPEYAFEARQIYMKSLDLAAAMREVQRLKDLADQKAKWAAQKAREESVTKAADPEPEKIPAHEEPVRQWIGFQAFLSADEAKALGQFMKSNGIKYKAI